jgi:hypothetical protein
LDEVVELDVSCEATPAGDQSLVFDAAHAPADVGRHRSYNNLSTYAIPCAGG